MYQLYHGVKMNQRVMLTACLYSSIFTSLLTVFGDGPRHAFLGSGGHKRGITMRCLVSTSQPARQKVMAPKKPTPHIIS